VPRLAEVSERDRLGDLIERDDDRRNQERRCQAAAGLPPPREPGGPSVLAVAQRRDRPPLLQATQRRA
jgi:hypothetical protein